MRACIVDDKELVAQSEHRQWRNLIQLELRAEIVLQLAVRDQFHKVLLLHVPQISI